VRGCVRDGGGKAGKLGRKGKRVEGEKMGEWVTTEEEEGFLSYPTESLGKTADLHTAALLQRNETAMGAKDMQYHHNLRGERPVRGGIQEQKGKRKEEFHVRSVFQTR